MKAWPRSFIRNQQFLLKAARFIYHLLPYSITRLDREFWNYYNFLISCENKTRQELESFQFSELKRIVGLAYTQSIFYYEKYKTAGFHPDQLKQLSDVSLIPRLSKEEIRLHAERMVLRTYKIGSLSIAKTSGTTGKALKLYTDRKVESREWASICYQWRRIGYKPEDPRVELRGYVEDEKLFQYIKHANILRINVIVMSEQNISTVVNEMVKSKIRFIHGYPSAVVKFTKFLNDHQRGLMSDQINGIMLASESVFSWQLEYLNRRWNKPIVSHYGLSEKVALGARWPGVQEYYFLPTYGILHEFDHLNICATSLINDVMPVINYKLDDSIKLRNLSLDKERQNLFPVAFEIEGRLEDVTYNFEKNPIPPAIVTFPFKDLVFVKNARIVQDSYDVIELHVEVDSENLKSSEEQSQKSPDDELSQLVSDLKKIYGPIDIKIIKEKSLLTTNTKVRWVECRIKNV